MGGKRTARKEQQFNPFIDILTCLAGILVLIIILVVLQSSNTRILIPTPLLKDLDGKTPVYFEIDSLGQVYRIPRVELNNLAEAKQKQLVTEVGSNQAQFLSRLNQLEIETRNYKVEPNFLLAQQLAIRLKPDARGEVFSEGALGSDENQWFETILDEGIDKETQAIAFIVRSSDASLVAFRKARAMAWLNGVKAGYELYDNDEIIKFGLGGTSIQSN